MNLSGSHRGTMLERYALEYGGRSAVDDGIALGVVERVSIDGNVCVRITDSGRARIADVPLDYPLYRGFAASRTRR